MMVDSGDIAASSIGTVIEKPHRIDRQVDAQRLGEQGRIAAQGEDVPVRGEHAGVGTHPLMVSPSRSMALDVHAEAEPGAVALGHPGELLGELEAVSGLVARQAQSAHELVLDQRQCGSYSR